MSTLILGITLDDLAVAAIFFPLLGAVANLCLATLNGPSDQARAIPLVKTIGIAAPVASLLLMLLMDSMTAEVETGLILGPYFEWITATTASFDVAFWMDPLSFLMGVMAAGLSLLMAFHVLGTVTDPQSLCRALGVPNLFLAFMLLLLWADSVPLFFVAWEGLALTAIFLLQGEAAKQGRPYLFWLTRLGNVAFFIGILAALAQLSTQLPEAGSLRLTFSLLEEHRAVLSPWLLYAWLFPALIYVGQWPASLWLWRTGGADSKVLYYLWGMGLGSAGLYLLTRFHFLILTQENAWIVLECFGALTCVIGAVGALGQPSLRRVLAYVTVSQWGLVLCAFGGGDFLAGILHWLFSLVALVTVLMSLDRVTSQRWSRIGVFIGVLALIGLPPFASFYSHAGLLWNFLTEGRVIILIACGLASLCSAVALARFILVPKGSTDERAPWQATAPILVLITALLLGLWYGFPAEFFGPAPIRNWLLPVFEDHLPIRSELFGIGTARIFILGCGLLWLTVTGLVVYLYARQQAWVASFSQRMRGFQHFMTEDAYLDRLIEGAVLTPLRSMLRLFLNNILESKFLDGLLIGGVASGLTLLGRGLGRLQTGRVQHYLIWFLAGVALFAAMILL